ncbi:MAG: FapA family protein [Treponema sp.]|jgi:uncharacterized protein (DUF342 family)|nr:FapA family protein [Treponema sp.]
MAAIAVGNAAVVIDPEEIRATFVFTPDTEGVGWDTDAAVKLARENGLNPVPQAAELDPFIQKAARAKAPMEMILLEGVPPEAAEAESVIWETLAVPGDLAPFKDEALAKAGPPELFRTRIEKVKRAALVKKPGKFPFMSAKEDVVEVWDKKEIKERVTVDPEVREIRYVLADRKLGVLSAAKPGKPGKNVFGKPIPPPVLEDSFFYPGKGILRDKNELRSQYGGFIRIGANWADIAAFAKPSWEVHTGTDGVTLFFTFHPGDPRFPVPKGADIIAEARKDSPMDFIPPEEIDRAVALSVKTREPVYALPLFKMREAEARVNVSPDLLRAELVLRKGVAGARPLEMNAISQAIRDSGVKGFNAEELKAAIKSFMEGSGAVLTYALAEGKAASRGGDRNVELLAKPVPAEEKAALLKRLASYDNAGGFPCSEADRICVVEKGEKAALVTPGGSGEEGCDVYGGVIPGLPGNDPEIRIFRGLRMRGSDIIAETDGLLLVKGIKESGEENKNRAGESFFGTVIEYRDARSAIQISPDAMEASAELYGARGPGLPLNPEFVMESLAALGVTKGIDNEAIETACKLASLKGSVSAVLARGTPPVASGGQVVTWLVPAFAEGQVHAGRACSVTQGQALAELSVAAAEVKGFDVTGKVLEPGPAGPELAWDETAIAAVDAENGERLVAKKSGELRFEPGGAGAERLTIRSQRGIRGDVGKETGNVHPGYSVIGGKDVLVGGSAGAALISAGGKAVIAGGINGRGVVRARNSIEAAFAERATLLAVEDIRLRGRCEDCTVKTNGRLVITGEDGKLSGGVCKSRGGLSAPELGAEGSKRTEISFGQDYLIKDQIEAGERESEKINAALDAMELRIKNTREAAALQAAREEKVRLLKLREQLRLKVFTLRERFEEHHDSEIAIKGAVYPGVVMESHDRYYEISEKRSGVVFFFDRDSGRIRERPIG